jgi:N-acetylneuraminic acid mutarotase
MKNLYFLLFILLSTQFSYSQSWVQKASLPSGYSVYAPFFFSIGGKLYVGGGWNNNFYNSFYMYDPATNLWAAKANVPDSVYAGAFFSINGKAYVVSGRADGYFSSAVYRYDPGTDTWTQMSDFGGAARQNTIGFALNGKGYVFGGFTGGSNVTNDMWEYNDSTDSWSQKANCPGPMRDNPTGLVINNQAYVGMGSDVTGATVYTDFYRFDPVADTFISVANSPIGRATPAHFVLGGLGYIGMGVTSGGTVLQDFTTYDPSSNTWDTIVNFAAPGRQYTFSDTVNGQPYVGAGADLNNNIFYNDVWTYGYGLGIQTLSGNNAPYCYPSPTSGDFIIDMSSCGSGEKQINIYDQVGQLVYQASTSQNKIQISNILPAGLYEVSISDVSHSDHARIVVTK